MRVTARNAKRPCSFFVLLIVFAFREAADTYSLLIVFVRQTCTQIVQQIVRQITLQITLQTCSKTGGKPAANRAANHPANLRCNGMKTRQIIASASRIRLRVFLHPIISCWIICLISCSFLKINLDYLNHINKAFW